MSADTVQVSKKPVYSTAEHETSLQYRITQNHCTYSSHLSFFCLFLVVIRCKVSTLIKLFGSDRSSRNANVCPSVCQCFCPGQTCIEHSISSFWLRSLSSHQGVIKGSSRGHQGIIKGSSKASSSSLQAVFKRSSSSLQAVFKQSVTLSNPGKDWASKRQSTGLLKSWFPTAALGSCDAAIGATQPLNAVPHWYSFEEEGLIHPHRGPATWTMPTRMRSRLTTLPLPRPTPTYNVQSPQDNAVKSSQGIDPFTYTFIFMLCILLVETLR